VKISVRAEATFLGGWGWGGASMLMKGPFFYQLKINIFSLKFRPLAMEKKDFFFLHDVVYILELMCVYLR